MHIMISTCRGARRKISKEENFASNTVDKALNSEKNVSISGLKIMLKSGQSMHIQTASLIKSEIRLFKLCVLVLRPVDHRYVYIYIYLHSLLKR